TTTVAVWSASHLLPGDPECGRRGCLPDLRERGHTHAHFGDHIVKARPQTWLTPSSRHQDIAQPSPAFLYLTAGREYLEKTLRAAFVVHHRAVAFSERSGRQNQIGAAGGPVLDVIQRDHAAVRGDIPFSLERDHRCASPSFLKRRLDRSAFHQSE